MTDALPTPAYVFDEKALRARIGFLREHLPSAKLCYAMKANPFLVESLASCVDLFEVCSPGEYRICERLKIAPAQIVLSGVYKERADIFRIVGPMRRQGDLYGRIAVAVRTAFRRGARLRAAPARLPAAFERQSVRLGQSGDRAYRGKKKRVAARYRGHSILFGYPEKV